jgi:carboxypeptidase PM20D1
LISVTASLAALLVVLFSIVAINTIGTGSRQMHVTPVTPIEPLPGYADRLAQAIRQKTIASEVSGQTDPAPFRTLHALLEKSFPAVHARLSREVHGGLSLLYRWQGVDPGREPVLLMSHLDVVPVEAGTEIRWLHPPFSGAVADGFIWGRGALDVKSGALGLLEAVERLLADGFQPACDVYLSLGHDEERGGHEGNQRIAEILRQRGIKFRFILDEGGALTQGIIEGISKPVALVGIAEKGYATISLKTQGPNGHSSMPPTPTAVGRVASAVHRLQTNPFPARLDGAVEVMLDYLGPELPWLGRAALANRWLTRGLIVRRLGQMPAQNALIRTTIAPTIARGGETANVLPAEAETLVNLRILPGESTQSALNYVRWAIADAQVDCELVGTRSEPSSVSSTKSESFVVLQRTITEVFPEAIVAPGLCMAATDSHHFQAITANTYRFLPIRVSTEDLKRIHGIDERIGVENYAKLIGFLAHLIENLSALNSNNRLTAFPPCPLCSSR